MLELLKVDRFTRRSACGRVSVELVLENRKRVFKWSFKFPPFMGTTFDFIAYRRPSPCAWYDKRQRNEQRLRARALFDAVEDGLGAEVGLMRKPNPRAGVYTKPAKRSRWAGASLHELREVMVTRFTEKGAADICSVIYPDTPFKKLKADEVFECLYAEQWAASYDRPLSEWGGMVRDRRDDCHGCGELNCNGRCTASC